VVLDIDLIVFQSILIFTVLQMPAQLTDFQQQHTPVPYEETPSGSHRKVDGKWIGQMDGAGKEVGRITRKSSGIAVSDGARTFS
jgi:hypothetical protein